MPSMIIFISFKLILLTVINVNYVSEKLFKMKMFQKSNLITVTGVAEERRRVIGIILNTRSTAWQ